MFGRQLPKLELANPVVLPNLEHMAVEASGGPISSVVTYKEQAKFLFADTRGNLSIVDRGTGTVVQTIVAHKRAITAIAVRDDGRLIATASKNGEVSLWTDELDLVQVFQAHKGGANDVAISSCGQFLASGGDDKIGRIQNLETGEVVLLRGHLRWINSVAWVDGRLVTGSEDGTICVWTTSGGLVRNLIGHIGAITDLTGADFSDNFTSVSKDGSARVWSIHRDTALGVLRGHEGAVQACAFDSSGEYIATAGIDRAAIIWNADDFSEIGRFPAHSAPLTSICWTEDGSLVTGGGDRIVRVWPASEMRVPKFSIAHGSTVRTCAVSRDFKALISGSWDYSVVIWDAMSMTKKHTLRGHEGSVECVAVDPALDRVLSASTDGTLRVWDINSGAQVKVIQAAQGPISCCEVAFGGRLFVSGGRDGSLKVWDADTDELWFNINAHETRVRGSALHVDGRRVATVGYDGTLAVWDVVAGICQMRTSAHIEPVVSCTFTGDGYEVVTASLDGNIRIWDIGSGGLIGNIEAHEGGVLAVASIGDGVIVSTGVDKTIRVWNLENTQMIHEHGLPVSPKSLTANGDLIAMGDSLGNVWRFNWKSSTECLNSQTSDNYAEFGVG
jgi:WD40 repeat protein